MNIRQITERNEHLILSSDATFSDKTKGRKVKADLCDIRTEFQRDRDKIIHSKSFRRLKHKTQVFIIPEGDHYRTRLTHTLEVSQIARTIARSLRLNEDLTEAIALAHDLGHTPFGHAGERVLDKICPYGFEHNVHSLRVVDVLENDTGLNLTYEVKDGILNHRTRGNPETKEGKAVQIADKIAYINHDVDDAFRGGIIKESDIPVFCREVLGETHTKRIDTMIRNVVENNLVMTDKVNEASQMLRKFMFEHVYRDSKAKTEEYKAELIIRKLYEEFVKNPQLMPEREVEVFEKTNDIHRVVCDYIAGMSDSFAVETFSTMFIPTPWHVK